MIRAVLPRARFVSVVHHPVGHAARRAALARHDVACVPEPRDPGRARARAVADAIPSQDRPPAVGSRPRVAALSRRPATRTAWSAWASPTATCRRSPRPSRARAAPASSTTSSRGSPRPPNDAVRVVHPGQSVGVRPELPGRLPARPHDRRDRGGFDRGDSGARPGSPHWPDRGRRRAGDGKADRRYPVAVLPVRHRGDRVRDLGRSRRRRRMGARAGAARPATRGAPPRWARPGGGSPSASGTTRRSAVGCRS